MQFLVIGRGESATPGINPAEMIAWVKQGIKEFQEDDRTQAIYGLSGEPAIALMCEVESAADLDHYLSLNPLNFGTEWDIHPLTNAEELNESVNLVQERIQSWIKEEASRKEVA
ncbi:hypothetical protein LCGC14_2895780 [marine sediment metagenome]|uniref:Uncharacterized protein n=1 Tax=marine sediment metagenome TaxID=412755 RepID=A0A0F9AM15_9ZZZZ